MSQIVTKLIDPSIYSTTSSLCVFELDAYNTTYLSSLRLMNLGAFSADFTTADRYNSQAGVLSMIKQITLFDGSVVLSQLNAANVWAAFKSVNRDNSDAFSMRHMYGDQAALSLNSRFGDNTGTDDSQTYPVVSNYSGELNVCGAPLATDDLSAKGYVDLRVLLKGLQAMRFLPTSIFKKLRLEIIWDLTPAGILSDVTRADSQISPCRPVLMVDCVSDPQTQMEMMSSMKQVVFDEIEVERTSLTATAEDAGVVVAPSQYILKNYDNKYVKRIMVAACPTSTDALDASAVIGGGINGAFSLYQPVYQVVVNGANVLPGSGVTKINEGMAMTTDTWGDISTSMFSYAGAYVHIQAAEQAGTSVWASRCYLGTRIEDNVSNLQLTLGRTATGITYLDGFRSVHVFGEVVKALQINDDGSYNIRYV